jgi:hypothetical protein
MLKKRILLKSLITFGILILGVVLFLVVKNSSRNSMVEKEVEKLITETKQVKVKNFSYNDLKDLPKPVQRYFRYSLKDGREYIRFAKIKEVGDFRRPKASNSSKCTAQSYIGTESPTLIFDAVMKQNTFVWFDVRDKYSNSKGDMFVNLFSGFNVLDESDIKELNITTMLRWAGEAVMYPTALLPSKYVKWEHIDEYSAKAIITDGNNMGTYFFYFNNIGEIIRYESNDRYDKIDGKYCKVRSIAHRSAYKEFDGIKVPTKFSVTRILPDGTHEEFWKGDMTSIQFD